MMEEPEPTLQTLLEQRFADFLSPLESFIHKQTTAGILLILFSAIALILAATPWGHIIAQVADADLGLVIGRKSYALPLGEWVSQGLLSLFFFLVGLEIKREILAGKLRDTKEIKLIILAALGGILVPALFYYLINPDGISRHGWGIPTATDTAFAVAILALMSQRVSVGITVFLTALAIFDDIGAILVISVFYAHQIVMPYIILAAITTFALFTANRFGIRKAWIYCLGGVILWAAIYKAGIHPTFAGLLLAMTIPARPVISQSRFLRNIQALTLRFKEKQKDGRSMLSSAGQHSIISDIGQNVREASTPLQRWEITLVTPITIIILPLFALFNAGFVMTQDLFVRGVTSPIALGIMAGLILGKPVGILSFTYAGVKLGIGKLPQGIKWKEIIGVSFLAGIGFTMSIFFTILSFPRENEMTEVAKLGIFLSSILSAIIGSAWICLTCPVYKAPR